jgi:hypothetical protein
LVDIGGGGRSGRVIGRLRRMAARALGRRERAGVLSRSHNNRRDDPRRRIDNARQRLKATIPPPED